MASTLLGDAAAEDTRALAAGDLNGDGHADLVVGNGTGASNRLLFGSDSGALGNGATIGAVGSTWSRPVPPASRAQDIALSVAETDADGRLRLTQQKLADGCATSAIELTPCSSTSAKACSTSA